MTEIFLYIVNMSITATILAVVVLLLRLLLKKAPKWISVLLWGLVALRLICPFAVESPFSLIPKTDWVVQEPLTEENYFLDSVPDTIPSFDSSSFGSDVTVQYSYYPLENSNIEIHKGLSISFILSCVWTAGMAALLLHTVISTIRLRKSIGAAVRVRDNVWESSAVESPFVLGMILPRIYVPRGMAEEKLAYVIAHEEAHIRRKDHWWKPLGFLLLTIHWFNPVLWLAYILLCRDIEMACDERVIKEYDDVRRADYSEALLDCSVKRKMITACPLAFGEVSVKERIKSVLHYKKPAFWIVVVAVVACIVAAVCFLTNPLTVRNPWVQEYVVGAEGILGQVDKEKYESVSEDFAIGADKYGRAVFKDPFTAFDTMKELYSEGLTLIAEEQNLLPISQRNYKLYKKFGWQVTSGSAEAQSQASFISGFLDIYENSFDKEKPNTDLPAPTMEGEIGTETVLISNVAAEPLSYEFLKQHQEEIWAYRATAIGDTVDETFRKWGERIAAAGVDQNQNCVVVYVYDFDTGDIGRFQKALGHLSYILVERDTTIEMIPDEKRNLTLEDVITLSAKGEELTWTDFDGYNFVETGSGLYIRVYEINETFSLWIGGGYSDQKPMYIRLRMTGEKEPPYMDIRDGASAVQDFIRLKHPLSFTALITESEVWDDDTVYSGRLELNMVEYIQSSDTARITDLGLTEKDMPSGYYIYDEVESITFMNIPMDTEFFFYDWTDRFDNPQDSRYRRIDSSDRWVSTQNFSVFVEYIQTYKEHIPPFIFRMENGKMTVREIIIM